MSALTVENLADMINKECEEFNYLFAVGLIRETLPLWKNSRNREFLCGTALVFVEHYLEEGIVQ